MLLWTLAFLGYFDLLWQNLEKKKNAKSVHGKQREVSR
uniref:Uncharacterized protein n=1 Tax=Arundo donax TaxID=35708 RepID=A0A0A8Z9N3_ARUDO